MFKIGSYVVFNKNICKVKEIVEKYYRDTDYYILHPIEDESLTISLPVDDNNKAIKPIMTKKQVEDLINRIPDIELIESTRPIHYVYKDMLNTGNHEDLIKIIKTAYLRNEEKTTDGKKAGATDTNYLKLAEKALYNEMSIVLGMTYDETKKYVTDKVRKLEEK